MFFPVGHDGNDAIVIHRGICAYYHGFSSYVLHSQSVGVVNVYIFIIFFVLACGVLKNNCFENIILSKLTISIVPRRICG